MALKESDITDVISYVKKEPRTVQEISKLIGRSWVTTESYVHQIKERTGLISLKVFRGGTKGALKIVYYSSPDMVSSDQLRETLYQRIINGRRKNDFEFMELFQHVDERNKSAYIWEYEKKEAVKSEQLISLVNQAESTLYCFSGNLSFLNCKEQGKMIIESFEEALKRGVRIMIIVRINLASLSNIEQMINLSMKYPGLVDIRHSYQPLRGFIIDDKLMRFKDEELVSTYKEGELHKNTRIFYRVLDPEWIAWMQRVFWNLFRSSVDYDQRVKELKKII